LQQTVLPIVLTYMLHFKRNLHNVKVLSLIFVKINVWFKVGHFILRCKNVNTKHVEIAIFLMTVKYDHS